MKNLVKIIASSFVGLFLSSGVFASDSKWCKSFATVQSNYNCEYNVSPFWLYRFSINSTSIDENTREEFFKLNNNFVTRGDFIWFILSEYTHINSIRNATFELNPNTSTYELKRVKYTADEEFLLLEDLFLKKIIKNINLRFEDNINFAEFSKIITKSFLDKNIKDADLDKWWINYERVFLQNNLPIFDGTHIMTNKEIYIIIEKLKKF